MARKLHKMEPIFIKKSSFAVIGKEGSTIDGNGFVETLWQSMNVDFDKIFRLVKTDEKGNTAGIWGLMSNFDRSLKPWTDFKDGLYLAGAEVELDVEPPTGWKKWIVPSAEYLGFKVENNYQDTFKKGLDYLKAHNLSLVMAVFDFHKMDENGQLYIMFPVSIVA